MSRTHDITISAFDLDRLEAELEAERALADRLASEVEDYILCQADLGQSMKALAAWKEARGD